MDADTFFDKVEIFIQLKRELYARLDRVRMAVDIKPVDDFDSGINCAKANELLWLEELLAKIERS
jgi:hypothetical protein